MNINGQYYSDQDRILLKLDQDGSGGSAFWLTRRQWLALARVCRRALENDNSPPPSSGARAAPAPRHPIQGGGPGQQAEGSLAEEVRLLAALKYRRTAAGFRIVLAALEGEPVVLLLQGRGLADFMRLIEGLAAKAQWDLPAALARIAQAEQNRGRRVLH